MDVGNLAQIGVNGLLSGGVYALVAVGLTLVFGVMRVINFAHGDFVMLGGYAAFGAFTLLGLDPMLALPLIMAVLGLAGWVFYRTTLAHTHGTEHLNQILLTLGVALLLQNGALLLFSPDYRTVAPTWADATVRLAGVAVPVPRLGGLVVALLLTVLLLVVLRGTDLGRSLRAVAQDPVAAQLQGINVHRAYGWAFAISTALAGAAGVITSVVLYLHPGVGLSYTVSAFAIVVLGGLGSTTGAFIGALLLGLTEASTAALVPSGSGWAEGVAFALLIGMLMVRPQGLFGRHA